MRARLNRTSRPAPAPAPAPAEPRLRLVREQAGDEFADERRMRDAGGPHDAATYHCACGYVFEAQVTTSVSCPHCGTGQAW